MHAFSPSIIRVLRCGGRMEGSEAISVHNVPEHLGLTPIEIPEEVGSQSSSSSSSPPHERVGLSAIEIPRDLGSQSSSSSPPGERLGLAATEIPKELGSQSSFSAPHEPLAAIDNPMQLGSLPHLIPVSDFDPPPSDLDPHTDKTLDLDIQRLELKYEQSPPTEKTHDEEFQKLDLKENHVKDGENEFHKLGLEGSERNLEDEQSEDNGKDESEFQKLVLKENEKKLEDEQSEENGKYEQSEENRKDEQSEENGKYEQSEENRKDEQSEENGKDDENDSENGNENDSENGNENENRKVGDEEVLMDEKGKRFQYPVRPDAEDCSYYLRTGTCKFGSNCKFNHPARRKNQGVKEKKEREDLVERPGQIECKYYLRTGGCKYGKACRYNHPRGKVSVAPILEYNFVGLPIRLGERECPYYMRTGSCKYSSNCRFNHPDPTAPSDPPPSGYGNGRSVSLQGASQSSVSSWSPSRTLNETPPFVPLMFSPTRGIPPMNSEWNGYPAPVYPPERSLHRPPPAFVMNNPPAETNVYAHHQQQMLVNEFPERPGQPECSYFLKTGDCKYRSSCKYHHPKNRTSKPPPCAVTDKGLPLRPDQNICTHYSRYGICKFGPNCKFDHPINVDQSPFGSSAGTPGRSTSRSDGNGNGIEAAI